MRMKLVCVSLMAGVLLAAPAIAAETYGVLQSDLAGDGVPGGGDGKAKGHITAEIDAEAGDFCYSLTVEDLDGAGAAHLAKGGTGASGDSLIDLTVTGEDDDDCVAQDPALLKAMLAKPGDYYVVVESAKYPKGAIRGQLKV